MDAKMAKKPQITEKMTIFETAQKYPETTLVFIKFGLHCIGCPVAAGETIIQAAKTHAVPLEKFLTALNKAIK